MCAAVSSAPQTGHRGYKRDLLYRARRLLRRADRLDQTG